KPADQVAEPRRELEIHDGDDSRIHSDPDEHREAKIDVAGKAGEQVPGSRKAYEEQREIEQRLPGGLEDERTGRRHDRVTGEQHANDHRGGARWPHGHCVAVPSRPRRRTARISTMIAKGSTCAMRVLIRWVPTLSARPKM